MKILVSKENFFNIMFGVIGALGLIIFNNMQGTLSKLDENITQLNKEVAIANANNKSFKEQLVDHEMRIRELEQNKTKGIVYE